MSFSILCLIASVFCSSLISAGNIDTRTRRWCDFDCVYIDIDPSLESRRSEFSAAVSELNEQTKGCFDLRDYRTIPNGDPFMWFRPSTGCSSFVGYRGCNYNPINIAPGCNKGAIIHEIMHALGAHHEHQRPDREAYVNIITANIQPANFAANFPIISTAQAIGPYDYMSIMHYGSNAFGITPSSLTVQTIDRNAQNLIGQRSGLSPGDVNTVNVLLCKNQNITKPAPSLVCPNDPNGSIFDNSTFIIEPPEV